jgi:hypothetical protein
MNQNILPIVAAFMGFLGLIGAFWALWMVKGLNSLRKNFFTGTSGKDLETFINELPGVKDIEQAKKMIKETPFLDFREEGEIDPQAGEGPAGLPTLVKTQLLSVICAKPKEGVAG